MKKTILILVFAIAINTLSAQDTEEEATEATFNKWSIELDGGLNKPQNPFAMGAYTDIVSPFVVNVGARYMFNNKFGLKADLGYNSFQEQSGSPTFDTKLYRIAVQGVINAGRVLNFETWTQKIGLLFHAGIGGGQLNDQKSGANDKLVNLIGGLTTQVRLNDRFVLTGDITTMLIAMQDLNFDGSSYSGTRGLKGIVFTGTVGLTYYLGQNEKHADWDWVSDNKVIEDKIKVLEKKIADLETLSNDTDRDGVVDYLDVQPNSIPGVMVDTKGRSIDNNSNGVPDELESYMVKKYGNPDGSPKSTSESVKNMINSGYIATYFDFGRSTPTNVSTEGIDFILTYMKKNPTAILDIIGHADEIGDSKQNKILSDARANSVKNTLIKAKIDPSRLNVIPSGEDKSVDKDSPDATRLVRRVTFGVR